MGHMSMYIYIYMGYNKGTVKETDRPPAGKENTMTPIEFAEIVNQLPVDKRETFFDNLKDQLSEEEWLVTVRFIGLYGMLKNPEKYNAMKDAVRDILCEELFACT